MRLIHLFEQNNSGSNVLYHFTKFRYLSNILESNKLIPNYDTDINSQLPQDINAVCFTRLMNSWDDTWWQKDGENLHIVRLVLDRRKLSNDYELVPFDYFNAENDYQGSGLEQEERIYGVVSNIKKYLISVDITRAAYDNAMSQDSEEAIYYPKWFDAKKNGIQLANQMGILKLI